jgi:S1-C subfamily serine protease
MKITRATLLKASPFAALIAGFAGGALAISPISPLAPQREDAQPEHREGDPYLQLAQATPLVRAAPNSRGEVQLSFAPVAARAGPAVVNVYAQRVVRSMARDPFFGRFSAPRVENSLGSGVIVREDGIIVTNNHVIEGAQSLKVVLSDRREYDAELVLADQRVDLAVLRIRADHLPTLPFADTQHDPSGSRARDRQPTGLSRQSQRHHFSTRAPMSVFLTTFLFKPMRPSTGQLGRGAGRLAGSSGSTPIIRHGGSQGIGFAIPSEMIRRVVESAVSGRTTVVRPWLGARVETVTQERAQALGLPHPEGVIVTELYPRSAGERAGLRNGDVILTVAGTEVHDNGGVRYQFATQRPGARVPLVVLRGGRQVTLNANAEAPPGGSPDPRELSGRHPLSGARVVTLTPATAEASGLDPFADGVFIQALDTRGVAARIGFRPGDIIDAVNGQTIRDAAQLDRAMAQSSTWVIAVERNGQRAELRF